MKLYKLTDEHGQTMNNTQWGEGVTHRGTGTGGDLCSSSYIHAYEHPVLALLLNPIHANFTNPRLWEAGGEVVLRDGQLKCGCVELTTVRELPVPVVTTEMRVEFAIRAALVVYNAPDFVKWANAWLDNTDRSAVAVAVAARATTTARAAAARAATTARATTTAMATTAARAAAWAAEAAAEAAEAAPEEELDLFALADMVYAHE